MATFWNCNLETLFSNSRRGTCQNSKNNKIPKIPKIPKIRKIHKNEFRKLEFKSIRIRKYHCKQSLKQVDCVLFDNLYKKLAAIYLTEMVFEPVNFDRRKVVKWIWFIQHLPVTNLFSRFFFHNIFLSL